MLSLGIGIAGMVIIKYGKKVHKGIPTSLVAVFLGILVVWGFGLTEQGIKIVGTVPGGLPGSTI